MGKSLFLFAGIFLGIFLIGFISATTEYEYQKIVDSTYTGPAFYAQTFTVGTVGPNENFTPTIISLDLGGDIGLYNISIRNINGSGYPSGGDLCFDSENITGEGWHNFSLIGCPTLQPSTQYALVAYITQNYGIWYDYEGSDSYLGGITYRDTSGGSDWETLPLDHDFTFDIFGTSVNETENQTSQNLTGAIQWENESILNVNSSVWWNNLNAFNSTQMINYNGILSISEDWLYSLFYTKSQVDNMVNGMINSVNNTANIQLLLNSTGIYNQGGNGSAGNSSWNQSFANTLYAPNTSAGIRVLLTTEGVQKVLNYTGIYNQVGFAGNYTLNTTAGIQNLINSTGIYNQGSGNSFKYYNITSSDITSNSTILVSNVISFPLTSGKRVSIECNLLTDSTNISTGIQFNSTVSGTSSNRQVIEYYSSTTAQAICSGTSSSLQCLANSSSGAITTPTRIYIYTNQSSSGNFILGLKSKTSGSTVNVRAGSWCRSIEF